MGTKSMSQGINGRTSNRRKTLFGGVLFDENDNKWECKISNISDTGAMLKTDADLEVGAFVELKINKLNDLRRAEVMRASGGMIGLRFMVKINKNKKNVSELFKIMNK